MDAEGLISQAKRIMETASHCGQKFLGGLLVETVEFLRLYAGERSAFYKQLNEIELIQTIQLQDYVRGQIIGILDSFIKFVQNGLLEGISIERKAQIDVVSDFLEQAQVLLDSKDVHPAAPTVVIGASLEEFLRNWLEEASLTLGGKKPSIDAYKNVLREADLITKQDAKDITAWSGLRNNAAHGEWEEVADRKRIGLMLEGVNLFMRKHTK